MARRKREKKIISNVNCLERLNMHTPGPWFVINPDKEGDCCDGINTKQEERMINDIVETDGGFYNPKLADAYLISAAPDLYEACVEVKKEMVGLTIMNNDGYERILNLIEKAIAKAEGRIDNALTVNEDK